MLSETPEETIGDICSFLGIEYDKKMVEFQSEKILCIGGNVKSRDKSNDKIIPDYKWKSELKKMDKAFFYLMGGGFINKRK